MYDQNNIFAKILRNELKCDKIYEDQYCLAFNDIKPEAPIHILFIPRGEYICYQDFIENARPDEITGFFKSITLVAKQLGLEKKGYRLITNNGKAAGQFVFHFHVHMLAGKELGEKL